MTARSKTWVPDKWSSAKTWILVPRQVWAPLQWRQSQADVAVNPGAPADGQCPRAWLLRESGDKHRNQTHCRHLLHASAYWMKPQMANNVFVGLATISYCSLKHRTKVEMRANRLYLKFQSIILYEDLQKTIKLQGQGKDMDGIMRGSRKHLQIREACRM